MRASATLLLTLALFPLACASDLAFSDPLLTIPLNPSRDPTLTFYHAYGDSITAGVGLVRPAFQEYPILLSAANALPLSDYAYAGDQACDILSNQIFPHADAPSLAARGLYTLLVSTNDIRVYGPGPYETVFNLCHQASIAWLAVPAESKTLASAPAVTTSGPTHFEGPFFNALWTDAAGATLRFPIQLTQSGPIYLWYRIQDRNPGTFTVLLDGYAAARLTTSTSPLIATFNGSGTSLALLRLPAVPAGAHTVTLIQTSAAPSGVGVVAIGTPSHSASAPKLLVGTTPRQLAGGTGTCSTSDAPCQAYIADITANVTLLRADGLNVTLFDSRKYMTGTPTDMYDSLHPNLTGHQELYQSIEDLLQ